MEFISGRISLKEILKVSFRQKENDLRWKFGFAGRNEEQGE